MCSSSSSSEGLPPTVAVIGCGPGGMFFCHALERRRRMLADDDDEAALALLPTVTCFERAGAPGGVWRAKRSFGSTDHNNNTTKTTKEEEEEETAAATQENMGVLEEETTNMYEALWTNGPKENIEFYDYTYDEHFGGPLPVYMPREPLLEYMLARVTRNCPNFFEKYVKFNTSVTSVQYDPSKKKFAVTTHDAVADETTVGYYDKCVWAAGENGKPKMPASLIQMFREGGFRGRMIHSSDTSNFESDVKGKRILLIGGSYSAEDLALMAIKVGVEQVYISTRSNESPVTWTRSWPQNKVKVLTEMIPTKVTEGGRCIELSWTEWKHPDTYEDGEETEEKLHDIDTVIFCTGYSSNLDMLDDELKAAYMNAAERKVEVPSDWKMTPNALTESLGDVEPGDVRWHKSLVYTPDVYRGVLVSNPSMMFIDAEGSPNPLFAADVSAWLLLAYITGSAELPSKEEMLRLNQEEVLRQLNNISLRYWMDSNYSATWCAKVADGTFDENDEAAVKAWEDSTADWYRIEVRNLADKMQVGHYPVSYGTYDQLNEMAENVLKLDTFSGNHRWYLDPDNKDENMWRTFRDYRDPEKFRSAFTGTVATALSGRWMDIDPSDKDFLKHGLVGRRKTATTMTMTTTTTTSGSGEEEKKDGLAETDDDTSEVLAR